MTSLSILLCFAGVTFLVALIFVSLSIRVVPNNKRISVYRLGKYLGDKGPGIVILIPFLDRGVMNTFDTTDEPANKDH